MIIGKQLTLQILFTLLARLKLYQQRYRKKWISQSIFRLEKTKAPQKICGAFVETIYCFLFFY